jgi:glucose-fructose oxidoreductase
VYGTKGCLCLDNAYEFSDRMTLEVEVDGKSRTHRYAKRDQVAPELMHFAQCVLDGRDPEPSGKEGLIDVEIIEAVQRAAETGRRVTLSTPRRRRRPTMRQEQRVRGHRKPVFVHAETPFK